MPAPAPATPAAVTPAPAPAPVLPAAGALPDALIQLVSADTQSYLARTAWLKAQSSAAADAPAHTTETAMQCSSSDTATAAAPAAAAPAAAPAAALSGAMSAGFGGAAAVMGNTAAPHGEPCDTASGPGTSCARAAR